MTATDKRFSFISLGIPGDTFGVVRFSGTEGLSRIYEFDVQLVSSELELDLNEVIQNPARLTLLRDQGNITFNGVLAEFEQLHQIGEMCFYRARLVPRVWWLTQMPYNQVFLDKSIPDIIEDVLRFGGIMDDDFELRLEDREADYPAWKYICQYRETLMSFIDRLMEREGLYYYFEQTNTGEKMIVTDTLMAHTPMENAATVIYAPPSGLDDAHGEAVVRNFSCRQKVVPGSVYLKNHNFGQSDLKLEAEADIFDEGRGEAYFFGDHFTSPQEGDRLSRIRAEEYQCTLQRFYGDTTIPFLRPGYTFTLDKHFRKSYNNDYLTVSLTHEGSQAAFMLAGLPGKQPEQGKKPYYWNTVTALLASVQFRAQRKTEKPRFYGTLNARIDAAGDGTYAELDEEGRYKVILPFDRSDRPGGKASAWIRMMQPYAGPNQGMHFPLHKGTEILLTFIDGDPDRPVIAGAVPGPEGISPVTSANPTKASIRTGRSPGEDSAGTEDNGSSDPNNFIEFNDAAGAEAITIHSPRLIDIFAGGKYKRRELGPSEESAHDKYNDEGSDELTIKQADSKTDGLIDTLRHYAPGNVYGYDEQALLTGTTDSPPSGFPEEYLEAPVPDFPGEFKTFIEDTPDLWCYLDDGPEHYDYHNLSDLYESVEAAWRDYWQYWVHKTHSSAKGYASPDYINHSPGVQISFPWFMAFNCAVRDSDDHLEDYFDASAMESHCQTQWDEWVAQKIEDWKKWQSHMLRGHIRASHRDIFNLQEGNIYDFGGYWNYNLGNCYVEEHLDQSPELNKTYDKDLLDVGGPQWTKVDWNKAVAADLSESDVKLDGNWNDTGGGTNVWVNKTFGNAYNYSSGKTIDVTAGDSLEIQHGGRHVEMGFRGDGSIKSWSWSEKGISQEKKWTGSGTLTYKSHSDASSGTSTEQKFCRDTGNLLSFSSSHQGFNSAHSFDFNWANTASASFSFSASTSFSFSLAASTSFSFSLAASLDLSLSAAAKAKIGIGAAFDFEMYWNPSGKLELKNKKFEYHGVGSRLDKEAELKAHNESLVLHNLTTRVSQANVRLGNTQTKLSKYAVDLGVGTVLKM